MTYEEYLDKFGEMTYTNVGSSMMPLLKQHRDLFTVRKKGRERCKPGDVVLYKRPPGKFILHRIVEVRKNDYVILGDNCTGKEYGIKDGDILGVMTGYVRNGKEHTVNDLSYRLYTACIMHTIPVRILLKKAVRRVKAAVKRVMYGKK